MIQKFWFGLIQFNKVFIQLENQGIAHHYLTMNETLSLTREIKNRNCPKCPLRWFPGSREAANFFCNLVCFWNKNCPKSNAILWTFFLIEKHLQNSHRNYFNTSWLKCLFVAFSRKYYSFHITDLQTKSKTWLFVSKVIFWHFFHFLRLLNIISKRQRQRAFVFNSKPFLASEPLQGHWVWWWW